MPPKHTRAKQKRASANRDDAFRLLFLNHPVPMWVYEQETLTVLDVNPAAVRRYGYSHDEFLGMILTDLRPPDDGAAFAGGGLQRNPMSRATSAIA